MSVTPGLLVDKENLQNCKHGINTNIFTPKDIIRLMEFPSFREAFEENKMYQTMQDYAQAIQPDTLVKIKAVAETAKTMEKQELTFNDEELGYLIGGPLSVLHEHLTRNLDEFPLSERAARKNERFALTKMTESESLKTTPPTNYYRMRLNDFINDINNIIKSNYCAAGFNRQIANISNLIETHKNYEAAKVSIEDTTEKTMNISK